jgi:hypothetical protein
MQERRHKIIPWLMATMAITVAHAQTDTTKPKIDFSGYVEAYYGYDIGAGDNHDRPGFIYSHDRNNEFNINLAYLKANYTTNKVRANLALMAGTYPNANLAAEPATLRNIFEANAGFRISKSRALWVDAGLFPSHIGFESAIGKDCCMLTRSVLADNSPYYETGAKVSHTSADGKWFVSGMVLNGWQRITRPPGHKLPAVGHQVTWKPSDKVLLNSSSFVGSDKPDSLGQMRYFHNLYGVFAFGNRWGLTLGLDAGLEKRPPGMSGHSLWYSPVAILRWDMTWKLVVAARGEYYADPDGVMISTGTPNGFQTFAYSLNVDVKIAKDFLWRIEGKGYGSRDAVFVVNNQPSRTYYSLTTSFAAGF